MELSSQQKQFPPCCDTNLLGSIEGPWSPVLQNLAKTPARMAISSGKSEAEVSLYTWEQPNIASTRHQQFVMGKTSTIHKSSSSSGPQKTLPIENEDAQDNDESANVDGSPNSKKVIKKTNGEEEKKSPDGEDRPEDDSSSQGSV